MMGAAGGCCFWDGVWSWCDGDTKFLSRCYDVKLGSLQLYVWEKWSRGFKGEYMCLYITTQMYGMIAIGIALSGYLAR